MHIKKQYNINTNCYIFVKNIGLQSQLLINCIQCNFTKFFEKLEFEMIKISFNLNNLIPMVHISNVILYPKLCTVSSFNRQFKSWCHSHLDTLCKIRLLDQLKHDMVKYFIIRIKRFYIFFKHFHIRARNIKLMRKQHKTRLYVKRVRLYYKEYYIGVCHNLKISHDSNTNKINIYGDRIVLMISNLFLKYNVMSECEKLYNDLKSNQDSVLPNTYFKEFIIHISINNHVKLNLEDVMIENKIMKCNIVGRVWKKDICWIKQCVINLSTYNLSIQNVRLRLFKSTADKLYKTFRPIYKQFYSGKRYPKPRGVNNKNGIGATIIPISLDSIQNNYLNTIGDTSSPIALKTAPIQSLRYNMDYMAEHMDCVGCNIFKIFKCTIDFQDYHSSFIFDDLSLDTLSNGIRISTARWKFLKQNIVYFDRDNKTPSNLFIVEYRDHSLYLYPYALYLNISLPDYKNTFHRFTDFICRIIDIFSMKKKSNSNYLYERFYIHSTRILCNYTPRPIQLSHLFAGKYLELINILTLKDMDFIIKEITITYPKNGYYILQSIVERILDDILTNNFDEIIKTTPIATTYKLQQEIRKIPSFTSKLASIFNRSST
jgi:hypothetical protein